MQGKEVMVIENNDLNMELVVALLTIEKIHVLCAEDGASGLKRAREHRPDLILMDIQLPGMDGLTRLRGEPGSPDRGGIQVETRSFLEMIKGFLDSGGMESGDPRDRGGE